ncbi:DUF1365 domain-containing protein [Acinetobacter sp. MB5]|uniref:DUF1365 domain-containing protein n=1 Tax=Acinetobacter sp. MB5 TaxID=2069438 RepID=UPI000DD09754|nr:DUF1365 domain-containing protein [Acinetobacter sp. MB5]
MQLHTLAIASAKIRHRRYVPKAHEFLARLDYLWFDADQIDSITQNSALWSSRNWNVLTLNPDDFLTQYTGTLREKVAQALTSQSTLQLDVEHQIFVLALPRCLGLRFNSVVFYYVFDVQQNLYCILSEITNTPWNERHVYVHDCQSQWQSTDKLHGLHFDFVKDFHVSPFMPMNLQYRWHFHLSEQQQYFIHMQLFDNQKLIFDATMRFQLEHITLPSQQYRYALTNAIAPIKMLSAIYWQAFCLWCKGIRFHPHPKNAKHRKERYENNDF